MKKLFVIMALALISTQVFAYVVQMPDGRIINCNPTSIGTIVCI